MIQTKAIHKITRRFLLLFFILGCKIGCLFYNLLIFSVYCGETGIRTPGSVTFNGFQDRRNRPLCHLSKTSLSEVLFVKSGAKVRRYFKLARVFTKNLI